MIVPCSECGKLLTRNKSVASRTKTGRSFCDLRCTALYRNKHKKTGTRRSKLEVWLELELKKQYPGLSLLFNEREVIGSELDIYIPILSLAFELNGIFHYEPIYGQERLASIQNNDDRKFQACLEKGVELCIIDSSQFKHFKPEKAQKYLDIISGIINLKIAQTLST